MHDWEPGYEPPWSVPSVKRERPTKAQLLKEQMEYMTYRSQELARANRKEKVFTSEHGNERNKFKYEKPGSGMKEPRLGSGEGTKGWREKADGSREEVTWVTCFGWMSWEELDYERQHFPRAAP